MLRSGVFVFCLIFSLSDRGQAQSFYDFTIEDSEGSPFELSSLRGKVTLVTNVASYCGYTTSHYSAYVELLEEYGEDLVILAFPCNEFGEQEPEDVQTIIDNMKQKFGVTFPIMNKISVLTDDTPEAWKWLIEQSQSRPHWNFYKYLVDSEGRLLGAWGPKVSVEQVKPYIARAVRVATYNKNEL